MGKQSTHCPLKGAMGEKRSGQPMLLFQSVSGRRGQCQSFRDMVGSSPRFRLDTADQHRRQKIGSGKAPGDDNAPLLLERAATPRQVWSGQYWEGRA